MPHVAPAALTGALDALIADPGRARRLLADDLQTAYDVLIAPDWARMHDILRADIAYRATQLAEGGLEGVIADLHPSVGLAGPVLRVESGIHGVVRPAGDGLRFQPGIFAGVEPIVILDEPWQPTLVYPARGTATLGRSDPLEPPSGLVGLLGLHRSRILTGLVEPATTTMLARRHGLAASTASAHVSVLHSSGLLSRRRRGREVFYTQTPLGSALAGTASAGSGA